MNPAEPAEGKKPVKTTPQPAPVVPAKAKGLDSRRMRLLLLAALGLSVVLFLAVFLLGSAALSKESNKMVDLKVKSQTADTQLANLEQAKKQVDKYSFFKDVAKTVIPNDKDQATDVVEITQMANASGMALQSITFPTSTLGLTTSTTGTPATQDATAGSSSKAAISQAKPVAGTPGLYSLQLIIVPQSGKNAPPNRYATYDKMIDFLSRIEDNRHTAQIADLSITPAQTGDTSPGGGFTFTLTINIFIKP